MFDGNKDSFVSVWACSGRYLSVAGGNITFYGWQTQKIVVYWNSSGLLTSCNNKYKTLRRQTSRLVADFNLVSTSAPSLSLLLSPKNRSRHQRCKQYGDFVAVSLCAEMKNDLLWVQFALSVWLFRCGKYTNTSSTGTPVLDSVSECFWLDCLQPEWFKRHKNVRLLHYTADCSR